MLDPAEDDGNESTSSPPVVLGAAMSANEEKGSDMSSASVKAEINE